MSNTYPTIAELGGRIEDLRRLVNPEDKHWSATNPSIGHSGRNNYSIAIRSSNYVITPDGAYTVTTSSGTIQSNFWFADLDKNFKIKDLRQIDTSKLDIPIFRGLEDPKLIWDKDHWKFTAVMMEKHTPVARMAVGHLDKKATKVVSIEKYPGIDSKRPEKNWMVSPIPNPNFDFIYGPNATIKDGILSTWMTDHPDISALRGNTNLHPLEDGTYLAVVHRMWGKSENSFSRQTFGTVTSHHRNYVHHFARYDEKGHIISLSGGFHFFQTGVEFAAGIVATNKEFVISYGSKDVSSHLAFISQSTVLKSLRPVVY
jgi:hypothetical protein